MFQPKLVIFRASSGGSRWSAAFHSSTEDSDGLGAFCHCFQQADITLCSYMLKAVAEGAQTIRILSDDTDIFVLLVYWTSRMQVVAKIQMESGMVMSWTSTKLFSS